MWRSLLAVLLGLSMTDVATFAQSPPDAQRLSRPRDSHEARPPDQAGNASIDGETALSPDKLSEPLAEYFEQSGVVSFRLVHGRLELDPMIHRKGTQTQVGDRVRERIVVTANRSGPSLQYLYETRSQSLRLSVNDCVHVRMESTLSRNQERCVLTHADSGAVRMTLSVGELHTEYEAASLVHLWWRAPGTFRMHFGRLVTRLLRGRSIGSLAVATNQHMIRSLAVGNLTPQQGLPTRTDVLMTVEQLGADRYRDRTAAHRQLLTWGTVVVPMLRQIPTQDLGAEQRSRISDVLNDLRPRQNDTPASLAMVLMNDPIYWHSIAGNLSPEQFVLSSNHLERMGLPQIRGSGPFEAIAVNPR